MEYIEIEAANIYLALSKTSFLFGIISLSQLLDRISTLNSMCEPKNRIDIYSKRILLVEEHEYHDDWTDGDIFPDQLLPHPTSSENRSPSSSSSSDLKPVGLEDDHFLHFIPSDRTGLQN